MRRVAVTGAGCISALGTGVPAFAAGLRRGHCAIGPVSLFPTDGFRSHIGGEARDVALPEWVPSRSRRRLARSAILAVIAADEAWRSGGAAAAASESLAIIVGTTTGGMSTGEAMYRRTICRPPASVAPRLSQWLGTPVSAPADELAALFAPSAPRLTISTACSSGANALGIAADWIRAGRASAVLCGGTDSLCVMTYSGFNCLQALDPVACRPFDRRRAGLTLGEGAAMFVFEDWESAQRRGAAILAEFVAYGVSGDAHHITQPRADGAGAALAMQRALAEAELDAEQIDYINAHGTGTPLNDAMETRAVKQVFGARAARVPISSTKSMIGHCLGAAGAIEALAGIVAIRGGFIPPTATLEEADPECDLDYVPRESRHARVQIVLSNSYGFGGNNTSLILRAAPEA